MSAASDLIERMERETDQQIDSDDPNNMVMTGLFDVVTSMMEKSSHDELDDVVAGLLVILHQMTLEYRNEQASRKIIASLLAGGLSPDDIRFMMDEW